MATAKTYQPAYSPPLTSRSSPSQFTPTTNNTYSTSATSYAASNFSDAGVGHGWKGQPFTFTSPSPSSHGPSGLRSMPSEGALGSGKKPAKLHKRTGSTPTAQARPDETMPSFSPPVHRPALAFSVTSSPSINQDMFAIPPSPTTSSKKKTVKIKPLLRKLTGEENHSLDLSRSVVDYDDLSISDSVYGTGVRSAVDVPFTSTTRNGFHARSTSGTSQYSIGTTGSKTGGQFVHPMRQTPRTHTPPISHSYQGSVLDSEYSADAVLDQDYTAGETSQYRRVSPHTRAPPLRLHTNSSATRLVGSQSTPSVLSASVRPSPTILNSADNMSPSTNISVDKIFKIRRTDSGSQVDSIQAARDAFNAREREKEIKSEKEEARAAERESRKRLRREEENRRKLQDRRKIKSSRSNAVSVEDLAGKEYSDHRPTVGPATSHHAGSEPQALPGARVSKGTAQGTWIGFIVWLKMRLLKLGRKVSWK